mgnify:CR=1 FL=1
MEKLVFHQISDSTYIGMITILDYEISLKKCLLEITIPPEIKKDKRIVVDLALKCGINQYRFVSFRINKEGKILWNSNEYVVLKNELIDLANIYLNEKKEIVMNSMLSSENIKEVLTT